MQLLSVYCEARFLGEFIISGMFSHTKFVKVLLQCSSIFKIKHFEIGVKLHEQRKQKNVGDIPLGRHKMAAFAKVNNKLVNSSMVIHI